MQSVCSVQSIGMTSGIMCYMQSVMTKEQEEFHAERVRNFPLVLDKIAKTFEMLAEMIMGELKALHSDDPEARKRAKMILKPFGPLDELEQYFSDFVWIKRGKDRLLVHRADIGVLC